MSNAEVYLQDPVSISLSDCLVGGKLFVCSVSNLLCNSLWVVKGTEDVAASSRLNACWIVL